MDSDNPSHHTSISDCQYAFVGNITVVVSKEQGMSLCITREDETLQKCKKKNPKP